MVVPTADADRGLGLSRLFDAARKLNVPVLPSLDGGADEKAKSRWDLSRPLRFESGSERTHSSSPAPSRMPDVNFSPVFNITGTDARDIAEQVETTARRSFAEMLRDFFEEERRVAYAT